MGETKKLYWKKWDGEKLEGVDSEQETYLNKCFGQPLSLPNTDDSFFIGREPIIVHEMLLPIEKEKETK